MGLALAALAFAFAGCGGGERTSPEAETVAEDDAGPVHVHGLGINPRDGALFIATHTGMWRVARGERTAERVGDRHQDTMGFTVVGPDHFLGSGHPDARDELPPHLGLIESRDAGATWEPISLLGQADFHVLRAYGARVIGYDATNRRLLLSRDGGRTWTERVPPAPVIDLVADPVDQQRFVVSSERGLLLSRDQGASWNALAPRVGLLAWPRRTSLYLVDGSGEVSVSRDGRSWRRLGTIGGEPAALLARTPRELYAALHDGTVKVSRDGGRSWTVRATP